MFLALGSLVVLDYTANRKCQNLPTKYLDILLLSMVFLAILKGVCRNPTPQKTMELVAWISLQFGYSALLQTQIFCGA